MTNFRKFGLKFGMIFTQFGLNLIHSHDFLSGLKGGTLIQIFFTRFLKWIKRGYFNPNFFLIQIFCVKKIWIKVPPFNPLKKSCEKNLD